MDDHQIKEKIFLKTQKQYWNRELKRACCLGDRQLFQLAIQNGANQFHEAIQQAYQSNRIDMVKMLSDRKFCDWEFAVYRAVEFGNMEILQLLLDGISIVPSDLLKV